MHLQICRINAYSTATTYIRTHTHTHSCVYTYVYKKIYTHTHIHTRVHTQLYTRILASRLRNRVSGENLAAGCFLKIRDFKIRVGKQSPLDSKRAHSPNGPLLYPLRHPPVAVSTLLAALTPPTAPMDDKI